MAEEVYEEREATGTQIQKAANEWLHPLVPYGPSKALKEMTRRIMALDTGKTKMTAGEAAHLAQMSAASQLNPFNGEIWAWVQIKNGERVLSIMPGRRGLLRHAHEQAQDRGTHFWPEYEQVTDSDRRKTLGIPDGAMAFECYLYDHKTVQTWKMAVDSVVEARKQGLEIGMGRLSKEPPSTFGLGVLTKEEMAQLDKQYSNKMTHVERTQKRAYMMALKQMFDLPLGGYVGGQGETVDDYIPEAQWREIEQEATIEEEETREAVMEKVQAGIDALYDDYDAWGNGEESPKEIKRKPAGRSWDTGVVSAMRDRIGSLKKAPGQQIVGRLNKSPFNEDDPIEWIASWMGMYDSVRSDFETSDEAARDATIHWARSMHESDDAKKRFGARTLKEWQKSDD